jgi:hypothetical protein
MNLQSTAHPQQLLWFESALFVAVTDFDHSSSALFERDDSNHFTNPEHRFQES